MGPTWSPPGSCWTQIGPMLAPWTLSARCHAATFSVFSALELWTRDTGRDVGEDNGSCIHRPCLRNSIQRCSWLHLTDIGSLLTRSMTSHKAYDLVLSVPTQAVRDHNKTHTEWLIFCGLNYHQMATIALKQTDNMAEWITTVSKSYRYGHNKI